MREVLSSGRCGEYLHADDSECNDARKHNPEPKANKGVFGIDEGVRVDARRGVDDIGDMNGTEGVCSL